MDLRYSGHAIDRMIDLGISEEMVEAVLLAPRWTPFSVRNIRYDGLVDGRRLCVVVARQNESLVVTAFWYVEELNQ